MIAAFILVLSVAALVQFGVSQWRSIWISIAQQPLSESLQSATGIAASAIGADDFEVLARTSEQLCPSAQERNVWLKEVRVYYRLVRAVQGLSSEDCRLWPSGPRRNWSPVRDTPARFWTSA